MVSTKFSVSSVFICYKCKHLEVVTGNGCWMTCGDPHPGVDNLVYVTYVNCYSCSEKYGIPEFYQDSLINVETHEEQYGSELDTITEYVGRPLTFYTIHNDSRKQIKP